MSGVILHIIANSFDDLLHWSLKEVIAHGAVIKPKKGTAKEIIGAHLVLTNPLMRISRSDLRTKLISALGETLWYLSGSDDFDHICYYIPKYRTLCGAPQDADISQAAYGPRIVRQLERVIEQCRKNDSRQVVLQIYAEDDVNNLYERPCTCHLQLMPRSNKLHMSCHMRSSDAFVGLTHDIFAFTFLQEYIARRAGLDLGSYHHHAGSFHLYKKDELNASAYLSSGLFEPIGMPAMPIKDIEKGMEALLFAERALRIDGSMVAPGLIDDYWTDLISLLRSQANIKHGKEMDWRAVRLAMSNNAYDTYLMDMEEKAN